MKYFFISFFIVLSVHSNEIKFEDFNLPVFEGQETLALEKLRGKKVVINFFASWCTACIKELPELNELKTQNNQNYKFLAINAGENNKTIKKFLNRYEFPYTILTDENREFSKKIGVNELPHTLIIDETGKVVYSNKLPPKQEQMDGLNGKSQ